MKILDVPVTVEIVIIPNPNREKKIEGSIELSATKWKKVTFDYYFNNLGHDIMTEGHDVDITVVDKIQNKKYSIQYTYPDKNWAKIHFRIRELWKLVEKPIAALSSNPLLEKENAGIVYTATEMIDKDAFHIFFDPVC